MLFHEIYGKYYQAVTQILRHASENGNISPQEIRRIVSESAFSESGMYIPEAVKNNWFLLNDEGESALQTPPDCPMTMLEKRWMKAILQDPRTRLFNLPDLRLEDVEPLFSQDMFCWFDRYEDGDPYEDPVYIQNFRNLSQAIEQNRSVKLLYKGSNGGQTHICIPYRLEYSEKDDKFRLLAVQNEKTIILNLAKVTECEILDPVDSPMQIPVLKKTKLVMELQDYRNALERAMLHFSHLEKETELLEKGMYRITLWYEPRDERELLIRILSFGPMLKVIEPDSLIAQIQYRIETQKKTKYATKS